MANLSPHLLANARTFRLDLRRLLGAAVGAMLALGFPMIVLAGAPLWSLLPIALVVETVFLVAYRNTRLVLHDQGVLHVDGWGKVTFARHWSEIDLLGYVSAGERVVRTSLRLVSGSQSCDVSEFTDLDEIARIVHERSPHASIDPSLVKRASLNNRPSQ